jgi:mono/diheme cytochrome c family protein
MSRPTIRQLWRLGALLRTTFALAVVLSGAATGYARAAADDDQAKIAAGEQVYNTYCATCHGDDLVNGGQTFDLRRLGADERPRFEHSVLNGKNQMPPWKGVLNEEQLDQLWHYIRAHAYQK